MLFLLMSAGALQVSQTPTAPPTCSPPGCVIEGPPPPAPIPFKDAALERSTNELSRTYWLTLQDQYRQRDVVLKGQEDSANAAIGSPAWEGQRKRVVGILAVRERVNGLFHSMNILANTHRAAGAPTDIAEIDRRAADIKAVRDRLAVEDFRYLAALVSRPTAR